MNIDSFTSRLVRAGLNVLTVIVLACLGLIAWTRLPKLLARVEQPPSISSDINATPPPAAKSVAPLSRAELAQIQTAPMDVDTTGEFIGVSRKLQLDTIIPTRPRVEVITYTVQTGDSLFSIAERFNIKPETLLWGNYETLNDNPHLLSTGQVLNILPTDGTYYQWNKGDSLNTVAAFFKVDPQVILSYPGNKIDLTAMADPNNPGIEPGQWLIIPGGKRELKDWGPPAISRTNPASARYYGEGYCGSIYEGAIGTGSFIWPTGNHSISGYTYSGIHPAIDIAGAVGDSVFASDSGVVVFAGWSNYGYGYMVVIDHGTGWQTAYAHLSAVAVGCGQSVFQGGYIGAVGNTGNSYGSHLHFEMVYNGAKLNPLDYVR